MTAKLFFNAAFPVMQVLLDDDPKMKEKFKDVVGTVQFGAMDGNELLACHLLFDHGKVTVVQGPAEKPDIALTFPTIAKMNALLRGGMALPSIKGAHHIGLLAKVLFPADGPDDHVPLQAPQGPCRAEPQSQDEPVT